VQTGRCVGLDVASWVGAIHHPTNPSRKAAD
jgi:hypothetical protein